MINAANSLPANSRQVNLVGKTFSRLTVIALKETLPGKGRFWICKCSCGNECVKSTRLLQNTPVISCGCARKESCKRASAISRVSNTKFTHPHKLKLKWLYRNMINRCHKPGTRRYERYGGRGISVCEEWRNNSTAFYQWAVTNGYSPELWIERKNVDGNYEPSNCCFRTPREQANNTSRSHFIEWNGTRKTIAEWGRETGVNPRTIWKRIRAGWPIEKTLTTA